MVSLSRTRQYFVAKTRYSLLLIFIFSLTFSIVGAGSETPSQSSQDITFLVGESTIVKAPWPTVRVAVTDPSIANVQVLTPDQVLLQGSKVGSTDLLMWSEDENQVRKWKVRVRLDTDSLQKKVDELFPDSTLKVSQSGESVILSGLLRSAGQSVQLHDLFDKSGITYVDMTSVAGVQQVQLRVRVAEVSRAALRSLNINTLYADNDFFGGVTISPSSGTPLLSDIDIGPGGFTTEFSPAVTIFAGVPRANFETFLQAIAENQYMRILANPTLVALSGEKASFLAGGEFPIPIVQSGSGGGGNSISVDYREYGVRVTFQPVVLGDGTIRLFVAPEVSDLTTVGAVDIEGFSIPALIIRKAETTLELKSGQTFAMAGLIKNKNEAINARIPGLGDLPILGPLFRSVRYQKNETELVVLVTASLVEPLALAQDGPVPGFMHNEPDDWELYIDGKIDGKEPKLDPKSAELLRNMGIDKLNGPGAWESYNQPEPSSRADTEEKWDPETQQRLRKTPW
ncbi:MAG: type II and III secretion system protein family protein [Sedimentisphaerales bacterium]